MNKGIPWKARLADSNTDDRIIRTSNSSEEVHTGCVY